MINSITSNMYIEYKIVYLNYGIILLILLKRIIRLFLPDNLHYSLLQTVIIEIQGIVNVNLFISNKLTVT